MAWHWPLRRNEDAPPGTRSGAPTGAEAEKMAEHYLCGHGLICLDRNYTCRQGEIDLVMLAGETLVFVEVKFRKNTRFGTAAETVTPAKQRKILLAAQHYLVCNRKHQHRPMRFDVVGITASKPASQCHYEWVQSAFDGSSL